MTTQSLDKLHLAFVVGIMLLVINILITYDLIDILYLLFIVVCYIRFICIRMKVRLS